MSAAICYRSTRNSGLSRLTLDMTLTNRINLLSGIVIVTAALKVMHQMCTEKCFDKDPLPSMELPIKNYVIDELIDKLFFKGLSFI